MEHKIITKPYEHGEVTNKARHVTGIHKWAQSSRFIGFMMMVFGWFSIPFEVLLRKDFGERWFTAMNYYAGLFLITAVLILDFIFVDTWHWIQRFVNEHTAIFHPMQQSETPDMHDVINYYIIAFLWSAYFYRGIYHRFKIKWRSQAKIPLHSFNDGTFRFKWLPELLAAVLNVLCWPFLVIMFLLIPRKQRRGKPFPKLITDIDSFTNTVVEPGLIFFVSALAYGFISFYLFISAFSMLIHAQWKEMARKSKVLDFQDAKVEAAMMRELKTKLAEEKPKLKETKREQKPSQPVHPVIIQYPKLSVIIDEMQRGMSDDRQVFSPPAEPVPATNSSTQTYEFFEWAKRWFKL